MECLPIIECSCRVSAGDEECDMFNEFVISEEDLQLPHSSQVIGETCVERSLQTQSQLSPSTIDTLRYGLAAGLQDEVNSSIPPLSPSVDGSGSHSPTSSFTFAGMKTPLVKAQHAQHGP